MPYMVRFFICSCVHNVECCVSTVHALHDELVKCGKNKRVYNDKEWPISKEDLSCYQELQLMGAHLSRSRASALR